MMAIENPSSDLPDPLRGYSLFALFPRTFTDPTSGNNSDDLESVHNFMTTKALISPNQHFDKANEIVQGGSEFSGSRHGSRGASENNNKAATTCNGNPQERRPALGCKRARFSLKLDEGQPSVSLEPSLDIDRLQDPEEFFSAYHKLEYAKEEIVRQTGGNMAGKNEYNPSANPRRRRPSIYGKEASYKHKHNNSSSGILENDDTVIASQETQEDNLNPSKFVSQEASNVEMEERELAGSVSNSEKIVSGLLDELLSKDIENLDGDGALSLLQEHLQIKAIDFDKYIHDFGELGKVDSMDLEVEISVDRKALSDIQNMVIGSREENPRKHKQVAENQNNPLASSTPPKRPSDASPSLERRVSKSKSFHLSFADDCDLSPAGSPTPEYLDRQSDSLGTRKESSIPVKLNSQVEDEAKNITCAASGSKTVIPGDILNSVENIGCVNASSSITYIDTRTNGSHGSLVDNNEGEHVGDILGEAVPSAQLNTSNDDSSRDHTATIVQAHGLIESEKNVEDIQHGATFTQPDVDIDDLTTENLIISQSRSGRSEAIVAEDHFMDRQPTNTESGPEQQNEERSKSSPKDKRKAGRQRGLHERKALSRRQSLAGRSEAIVAEDLFMNRQPTNAESGAEQQNEERPRSSPKDRKKAGKACGLQERKALSRRQSLAGAGTCWKSGVRRSNRNKMKPLEYWKGERVLYGRVHESLVTVIGVKCISSPTSNGKERKFSVTSYVSDEHKELVDLAALH